MIITKRVGGEVDFNDGQFAELQTFGCEGIEAGLWLGTFQIHREDTDDWPEEFQQRFCVGMSLDLVTTTEIIEIMRHPICSEGLSHHPLTSRLPPEGEVALSVPMPSYAMAASLRGSRSAMAGF